MKNALKILILILSVALIIGALVMVTGAEEQQDEKVSMTINGNYYPSMPIDDALTIVQTIGKGRSLNADETVNYNYTHTYTDASDGNKEYTYSYNIRSLEVKIKLLGNVTQNQTIDTTAGSLGFTDKDIYSCKITINLNGYDLAVVPGMAYSMQYGEQQLLIEGEGSVDLPTDHFVKLMSGAKFYVRGSGAEVRFYGRGTTNKALFSFGGSNNSASVHNARFEWDIESDSTWDMTFVDTTTANGTSVEFVNCYFDIDHKGTGSVGGSFFKAQVAGNGKSRTINVKNSVIDIDTESSLNNFTLANTAGGIINFDNVDVNIDMSPNNQAASGQLFYIGGEIGQFNLKNSTIDVNIVLETSTNHSAQGYYIFKVLGGSRIVVDNTYVNADCSGIHATSHGMEGVPAEGIPSGDYAFVTKNSKLIFVHDNEETISILAATRLREIEEGVASDNMIKVPDALRTILIAGSATSTGDIYLRGSYLSANYRMINGMGGYSGADSSATISDANKTASQTARIITFDNSTVEREVSNYRRLNAVVGSTIVKDANSGEAIFDGAVYANFINSSRIILNNANLHRTAGGGWALGKPSFQTGVAYAEDENGNVTNADVYAVDLEAGTRINANSVNGADLPKGASIVSSPFADSECPYVVSGTTTAYTEHGSTMDAGVYPAWHHSNNNFIGNRNQVYNYVVPSSTDAEGSYTLANNTITFNDNKTVTLTGETYLSCCAGEIKLNSGNAVIVYQVEFMPASTSDNAIPFNFKLAGNTFTDSNSNGVCDSGETVSSTVFPMTYLQVKADGTSNRGNVKAGEWNTYTIVIDASTNVMKATNYINGKDCGTVTVANVQRVKDMRITIGSKTLTQGASCAFSNVRKVVFTDAQKLEGTFDPADYKDVLNYEKFYSFNDHANAGDIMFGNTPYRKLNEALAAAGTDKHVTLFADNSKAEVIDNAGSVYTNGYTLTNKTTKNYTKNLLVNTLDNYVKYYATKDVTYTWNTIDGTTSIIFQQGGTPFVDDRINVTTKNKAFYKTGILYFGDEVQWTTVNPADFDNYADYAAALEGGATMPEVVDGNLNFYPVYENAVATITQKAGNNVHYVAYDQDISSRLREVMPKYSGQWDVVLYDNVTSANYLKSRDDDFIRTDLRIDLNGYRFDLNLTDRWCSMASSGIMRLYSSKEGGVFAHFNSSQNVNDFMMPKSNTFGTTLGGKLYLGTVEGEDAAYGNNLTVYSPELFEANGTSEEDVFINGGTYIFNGTAYGPKITMKKTTKTVKVDGVDTVVPNNGVMNIKNATFINACLNNSAVMSDSEFMFLVGNGDTMNFINCTFIANKATERIIKVAGEGEYGNETVTFTNCKVIGTIGNTGDANDVISVDADTIAYRMVGVNTPEGYVAAYTSGVYSTETVTFKCERPVLEGGKLVETKYVYYTNDPAFTAEDAYEIVLIPDMNMAAVAKSDVTEYTFVDLAGESLETMTVKNGENVLDFVSFAPAVEGLTGTTLKVTHTGEWTVDGTTVLPVKRVAAVDGFSAFYNLSLYMNFDINFYVPAEFYAGLDQATKDLLSEETINIGGTDYYYMEAVEVDANKVFTTTTFTVTLEDQYGHTKTLNYTVSVKGYINTLLNYPGLESRNYELAYVITDYLADAYAYFTVKDVADGANILASMIADKDSYAPASNVTTLPAATTAMGDASGSIAIYVDLTSSPKFVITALEDGVKIAMAGAGEKTLAKDEVYEISKRVFDFDNEITVTKADGKTGTYDLVAYLNTIASDAALADLAVSFYNYVTYAEAFRPAGT